MKFSGCIGGFLLFCPRMQAAPSVRDCNLCSAFFTHLREFMWKRKSVFLSRLLSLPLYFLVWNSAFWFIFVGNVGKRAILVMIKPHEAKKKRVCWLKKKGVVLSEDGVPASSCCYFPVRVYCRQQRNKKAWLLHHGVGFVMHQYSPPLYRNKKL